MECIINNKFQHVSSFNNSLILNTLEVNLKAFLQHSFLSIGSWSDVQLNQQNLVTSPLSDLQLSEDPAYKRGQVWISAKKIGFMKIQYIPTEVPLLLLFTLIITLFKMDILLITTTVALYLTTPKVLAL